MDDCFLLLLRNETLFRVAALAAFLQPAQAVFKLLSLKTAVLSTTVSLCLYLNYALGFLMFACAAFSSKTRQARVASLAVCTCFSALLVKEKMHTHKQNNYFYR